MSERNPHRNENNYKNADDITKRFIDRFYNRIPSERLTAITTVVTREEINAQIIKRVRKRMVRRVQDFIEQNMDE